MTRFSLVLTLAVPAVAHAYETDQLTWRDVPLADATTPANAEADRILAQAIERTNARTACRADDPETRRILAKEVERQTDPDHMVWRRGLFRGLGFSGFSHFLETDPDVPIRILPRDYNIYARTRLWENWAQWLVDSSGVVRMGDVYIGTDKFDHFWDLGWQYYDKSHDGSDRETPLLFGLNSEGNFRGYGTSGAVSYADLRANYDGYRFYISLLTEGSIVRRGADGCVVQVRPWDWGDYVDRDWDEFLNPSSYTPGCRKGIDRWLEDHADRICALDAASRSVPPAKIPQSEYLILDRMLEVKGKLPPGYQDRDDAFDRAARCPAGATATPR